MDQQAALRNLNAHLNRIEVITYDQLLRIADRVLAVFRDGEPSQEGALDSGFDGDIPF